MRYSDVSHRTRGRFSSLFKRREKEILKPDDSYLRVKIASTINVFLSVRGLDSVLKPETAVVMRKEREVFVTQDVDKVENRDSIVAVAYLKDAECYAEFKAIQGDHSLRVSALGQIAADYLADQLATQLLKQASELPAFGGNDR